MESNDTKGLVEEQSRKRVSSDDAYWPPLLSIAPMLDVTDRHFRYFMRCLSVGEEWLIVDDEGVDCEMTDTSLLSLYIHVWSETYLLVD